MLVLRKSVTSIGHRSVGPPHTSGVVGGWDSLTNAGNARNKNPAEGMLTVDAGSVTSVAAISPRVTPGSAPTVAVTVIPSSEPGTPVNSLRNRPKLPSTSQSEYWPSPMLFVVAHVVMEPSAAFPSLFQRLNVGVCTGAGSESSFVSF